MAREERELREAAQLPECAAFPCAAALRQTLCLSSCGQEEPRCLCEFRNKKINLFNRRVFVCVLRKYARGARTYPNSRISD